tara:strand:+ start:259 stop:471 length:213 start_codon:yes stop_codon:yes gene_type:complete
MENIVRTRLSELDFSQPLSFRNILRRSYINGKQINKKYMLGFLYHSDEYRKIDPLEVGCGKHKVNVWARV